MKITPISINNNQYTSAKIQKKPHFGSFLCNDKVARCTLDSGFFRGNDILFAVIRNLEQRFSRGTEILDFACSNGQEALSILAQLSDKLKYKIRGFDVSQEALSQARSGVHTVFSGAFDSFLLEQNLPLKKKLLKKGFTSIMVRTEKPDRVINDSSTYHYHAFVCPNFEENYFRIKEQFKDLISFDYGDIMSLESISTSNSVGAILFRNAFYHLCNNNVVEVFTRRAPIEHTIDTREVAFSLVQKVNSRLDIGGVFALGEHPKDNIFLANKFSPSESTIRFGDSPLYVRKYERMKDVLLLRISPIVEALESEGNFVPIHFSNIKFLGKITRFPTVWQKIKD